VHSVAKVARKRVLLHDRIGLLLSRWFASLCIAFTLPGASAEDTVTLGRKALVNEGVAMAWTLSQRALTESPESAAAHEFAGEVLFRRGDFSQARNEFQQALKADARFALAWWGLARIAECESMHRTAGSYFQRAYELDPRNPWIFLDWALRLEGRQRISALEKYASMIDPERNPDEFKTLGQRIALFKALDGHNGMSLASPYKHSEIPLAKLAVNSNRTRVYGLEVSINGAKLKLVLDTGASGILIKRAAAEKSRIVRLSDATLHGIGSNAKLSEGYFGIAEHVRIGDVEFRDALIRVTENDFVATEDGLIGTDLFSQFLIALDFANLNMRLDPLPGFDSDGKPVDRTISPEMQHFTQVFRFGHMLLIPTRVGDSREALFLIDSGATRTLISYDIAAQVSKVRSDDAMRITGINGQVSDIFQTGSLFLQFAGFRQSSQGISSFNMLEQSRTTGTEVSGFLGLPVLSLFTLVIDYRDGLVNFDYKGSQPAARPIP
jgi:tetratricopeptide (TPR) repeat protein